MTVITFIMVLIIGMSIGCIATIVVSNVMEAEQKRKAEEDKAVRAMAWSYVREVGDATVEEAELIIRKLIEMQK